MVFVTSNIPWCLLDNEYFIKALDMLRPGHPRLTSKNASTDLKKILKSFINIVLLDQMSFHFVIIKQKEKAAM